MPEPLHSNQILSAPERSHLLFSNGLLLIVETFHDLDHVRQTDYLCFSVSTWVWVILAFGFSPTLLSWCLAFRSNRYSAHLTALSAALLTATLLAVHLWGGPSFFGGFSIPYTRSNADLLSWAMLWLLLAVGLYAIATSMPIVRPCVALKSPNLVKQSR